MRKLSRTTSSQTETVAPEVTPEVTLEVQRMLTVLNGDMTRCELMDALGLKDEKHFCENYQQTGIAIGLIEMTISEVNI